MYELKKPISEHERMDFISQHIYKEGLRLEDTEMFLFALEKNEIMGEKEIEIDVPDYEDVVETVEHEIPDYEIVEEEEEYEVLDFETIEEEYEEPVYDEEGNPVLETKVQEIQVPKFDEEGNAILDEDGNQVFEIIEEEYQVQKYETKTREVTVPKMIEVEETITVPDYDEEGNETGGHEETITKQVQSSHKETRTIQVEKQVGTHIETETINYTKQVGTHKETIIIPYPVVNENYEEELAEEREKEFNLAFFNTSLGYIRRKVTMKDGSKKDFLADLLLSIKAGLDMGLDVKILTYDKPPFDRDVEDWTEFQHEKSATAQFIAECLQQTVADFK